MSGFWPALGLLTRLPIGHRAAGSSPAATVPWFPVIGLVIALLGAGSFAALSYLLPPLPAAALTIAALTLLTGGFHEDGLADIADAFGGGWTPEQRLAILDDPRLGAYGTLSLAISAVIRISLLAALTPWQALALLTAAHTLSRAGAIAAARALPNAKPEGLGADFLNAASRNATGISLAIALLFAGALTGWWAALFAAAAALAVGSVGRLAIRKIGGVTGDVIGGMQQIAELAVLVAGVALIHTYSIALPWWAP